MSSEWYPFFRDGPSVLDLVEPLLDVPPSAPASWLRPQALWLLKASLSRPHWTYDPERDAVRIARLLERLPEGPGLFEELSGHAAEDHALERLLQAVSQRLKKTAP
jgi:hypothetical protein